ncbi:transposase [Terrabacter sp. GCM10028922]|uniref:IS110 family transposase n=1 Tax=Terrabacter sp. GCM10028922 TaxID=3273428 RepID=UPI00361AC6E9
MNNGSGVSRGDRNRNARLSRLRAAVPVTNAIVGIDLADRKQMLVVTDHDSKVLARRTFRRKAWDLGAALDWAADRARAKGFAGVTVACEPTGHRWMVLAQLAAERDMAFVCVQPALSSWVRRTEDLTSDKTDDKDAVLISRLTAQLRCYLPEPVMRAAPRGLGCATSAPAGRSCSRSMWPACRRSGTCSSACGRPRSRRPSSRSSRPRGSQRWPW